MEQEWAAYSFNYPLVYVMFYYEILWFYQDFKTENLCFLNMHSVHAARILDLPLEIVLIPPKRETLLQL